LPWLANEATPRSRNSLREISGWLAAAALFVGGGAYWLVERGAQPSPSPQVTPARTTTVVLPQAETVRQQQASKVLAPSKHGPAAAVRRAPLETRHIQVAAAHPTITRVKYPEMLAQAAKPRPCKCASGAELAKAAGKDSGTTSLAYSASHPSPLWPRPGVRPSQFQGRIVQVGAFAQVDEAKLVWRDMVRAYPAVAQFQPALIENRDWNGHPFYQFQVGTASQADSEMLCQSMQRLNFRCAVMGPAWRAQP
jgi:hypothetical protein